MKQDRSRYSVISEHIVEPFFWLGRY